MHTDDPDWSGPASDWIRYRPTLLPGVTLMRAHFTDHAFERHSHAEFGIGLTYGGVQTFHCGGTIQTSTPGNVIFLNPDQAHDGLPGIDGGYDYGMLYIDPALMDTLRDRPAGVLAARHFREVVVHAPEAARRLHRAIGAMAQARETLRGEGLMLDALVHLLLRYGEAPGTVRDTVRAGRRRMLGVRDLIRDHADQDLSIADLAREAGVSRVYLSRAFERQFGVPPHVYLNAVRLDKARALLLSGMPPAAVAAAAGFADQSHFSRRFKGAFGLAPGAWLRQMRRP